MGPLLRELMAKATVEKIVGTDAVPHIISFVNENTGALNATITPGGIGQTKGEQLKFGNADTEGPFFVNLATNVATRATVVPKRFEGELMFLCPNLPPGQYRHEVRRLYGMNKDQMRIGHLNVILTVA